MRTVERVAWLLIAVGFLCVAYRASENGRYQIMGTSGIMYDTRTGQMYTPGEQKWQSYMRPVSETARTPSAAPAKQK
jgi:hypothetical protein